MDIYSRTPVNKTASIVTNQSGTSDDFMLNNKEKLKVLGMRKKHLMDMIVSLKKEIGIDARKGTGANTKYPRKILQHPSYRLYRDAQDSITKLDQEIYQLRRIMDKTEPRISFENRFVTKIKEKYPDIYEEIRDLVNN